MVLGYYFIHTVTYIHVARRGMLTDPTPIPPIPGIGLLE